MDWTEERFTCKCGSHIPILFRWAYKHIQFLQNGRWIDVSKSSELVITDCGCTFWIPLTLKIKSQI